MLAEPAADGDAWNELSAVLALDGRCLEL
jgi:hypothetical protein